MGGCATMGGWGYQCNRVMWGGALCTSNHPYRKDFGTSTYPIMSSLLVLVLLATGANAVQVSVSEVQNYTKLANWEKSSLYRVEANAGYETNPLLIHLVGSRYGKCRDGKVCGLHGAIYLLK